MLSLLPSHGAAVDGDVARAAFDGGGAAQGAVMVVSDQNDGGHRAFLARLSQ